MNVRHPADLSEADLVEAGHLPFGHLQHEVDPGFGTKAVMPPVAVS
jgi:hypothetical protein